MGAVKRSHFAVDVQTMSQAREQERTGSQEEEENTECPDANGFKSKPRRKRMTLTDSQRSFIEKFMCYCDEVGKTRITRSEKEALGMEVNLTAKQVSAFMKNHRFSTKKRLTTPPVVCHH